MQPENSGSVVEVVALVDRRRRDDFTCIVDVWWRQWRILECDKKKEKKERAPTNKGDDKN